ncbi:MAG: iron-containing alcohol dehydrogenase [Lachnospiraceae bacterium]|nr:iron-containing alcohol dehydrogenase [Lachnospiraceae bacterium]
MVTEFVYAQPVKILFGAHRFDHLSEILKEHGIQRAVVACDRFFSERIRGMMQDTKEIVAVFDDVEENPQLSGVIETARLAKEHGADCVIGIGGGSTIDTAKFAAAVAADPEIAERCWKGEVPFPKETLHIVAVPTTAGTGSEVTQVSVVSHGRDKKTINNPVFMPLLAIVDPYLSSTVPPRTTMNTGIDAMAHALEGYWSKNHQPISDLCAIEAVRLILENLERAYRDGNDLEARTKMAYASLLGGLSFALPKTAGSHACSYPLSEDYHLPHGEACAFTLDSFVRINADERLEYLSRAAGLKDTAELAERIRALKETAGLRRTLSDLGDVDMDKLVRDCAAHPLMQNNPVQMTEEKLREMFEALQ